MPETYGPNDLRTIEKLIAITPKDSKNLYAIIIQNRQLKIVHTITLPDKCSILKRLARTDLRHGLRSKDWNKLLKMCSVARTKGILT